MGGGKGKNDNFAKSMLIVINKQKMYNQHVLKHVREFQ